MKAKKFKSILVSVVGILYMLVGLLTGGLFFASSHAATTNILSAIKGYDSTTGKYTYVYLGEYPQEAVLKVKNGASYADADSGYDGWSDFPNYSANSIAVDTTIKGYIEHMNEQYYNEYLDESNPNYQTIVDHFNEVGITFGSYDWQNSTVLTFYPQENYETKYLYFDVKTGYYTLKVSVLYPNTVENTTDGISGTIAYPAGTKFHTYNHVVDSVNKHTTSSTYTYNSLTTSTAGISRESSSIGNYMDIYSTNDKSYNIAESGKTYLYVVEPIKWRVLAREYEAVTLLSENILDYQALSYEGGNEWAYSTSRVWLNNQEITILKSSNELTIYPGKRTFLNMAFSETVQNAIKSQTIQQNFNQSKYNELDHYYTQEAAGGDASKVEEAPITIDKVWYLNDAQVQNGEWGLASSDLRIAYNTDYALTGTFDYKLSTTSVSGNYLQSLTSWRGGKWLLRTAGQWGYVGGVGYEGNVATGYSSAYGGVRPAMNVDLSKLNVASIEIQTQNGIRETDGVLPSSNGTLEKPILLDYTSQLANATANSAVVNTSVTYTHSDNTNTYASLDGELFVNTDFNNIANKRGGSWSVDSITDNGDGTYSHVIKVSYYDQVAGTYLVAKVTDGLGNVIAMAPITSNLVNTSNVIDSSSYYVSGSTYFQLTTSSQNIDYKVYVYASQNGALSPANIYRQVSGNLTSAQIASTIKGYDATNGYTYIYLGEYPQEAVLKVKNGASYAEGAYDGWSDFPNYSEGSVAVDTIIKGYIEELNEYYYNEYLKPSNSNYQTIVDHFAEVGITFGSYDWQNATVLTYYPQENFENSYISFDASNGYYTLKTGVSYKSASGEVTEYTAGTKFHTYNVVVDSVNKDRGYTKADGTYVEPNYKQTTLVTETSNLKSRTNVTEWKMDISSTISGKDTSYNPTIPGEVKKLDDTTQTYFTWLYVVKPIKWRVLEVDDANVLLLSETILDSGILSANRNEWAYSDIRGWLNGEETEVYRSSNTTLDTLKVSNKSFINMAFSDEIQSAIISTTVKQDKTSSYYANSWHSYAEGGEEAPTTTNKIFLLSETQANNTSYFASSNHKIAYNTDYAISTGNYDAVLDSISSSSINYLQNYSSGTGGLWLLRSAPNGGWQSYTRRVDGSGGINHQGYNYTIGVRPALNVDLSALNVSSFSVENATFTPGTKDNPIDANNQFNSGSASFNAYSIVASDVQNITNGSWKVLSSTQIDSDEDGNLDKYQNLIKVDYSGLQGNSNLFVKVSDSYGKFIAFATIAKGSIASKDITYFTLNSDSQNLDDYVLEFFTNNNTLLTACGIYQLQPNGQIGVKGNIYIDTVNGHDSYSGLLEYYPVKTFERAKEMAQSGATIVVINTIDVTENTSIDLQGKDINVRSYFSRPIFNVQGTELNTVTLELFGFNFGSPVLNLSGYDGEQTIASAAICANYANLSVFESTFDNVSSKIITTCINATNSTLTVVNSSFKNNQGLQSSGCIMATNCSTKLVGSLFEGNESSGNHGSAISLEQGSANIQNCQIINWVREGASNGAVNLYNLELVVIENCYFNANKARFASSIKISANSYTSTSQYRIYNCQFVDNNTSDSAGTVYAAGINDNLIIDKCNFINNVSESGYSALKLNSGINLTLSNSMFVGNKSTGSGDYGGAVYYASFNNNNCTIFNCEFKQNVSVGYWGAVHINSAKEVKIDGCNFVENIHSSAGSSDGSTVGGSALSLGNHSSNKVANAVVSNCNFVGNVTKQDAGVVIINKNAEKVEFSNCNFDSNQAERSGGVLFNLSSGLIINSCNFNNNISGYQINITIDEDTLETTVEKTQTCVTNAGNGGAIYNQATMVVNNCNFDSNGSFGTDGGAIALGVGTELNTQILNSNFINNTTYLHGGAVYLGAWNNNPYALAIDGCYFEGNISQNGSAGAVGVGYGAHAYQGYANNISIKNSNFMYNSAQNSGGALAITNWDSGFAVSSCYFKGNIAATGGAIANGSGWQFTNCVFEHNIATSSGSAISGGLTAYGSLTVKNNVGSKGAISCSGIGFATGDNLVYIYDNYANLYDIDGNKVTTYEQLATLLDTNGNIVPLNYEQDEVKLAYQSNLYLEGSGSGSFISISSSDAYTSEKVVLNAKIGYTLDPRIVANGNLTLAHHYAGRWDFYPIYVNTEDLINSFVYNIDPTDDAEDIEPVYFSTYSYKPGSSYVYIQIKFPQEGSLYYKRSFYEGLFDSREHTLEVKVLENIPYTINYDYVDGLKETDYTGNYPLESAPMFTNVGEYTVYYKISAEGYSDITGYGYVKILPTITIYKPTNALLTIPYSTPIGSDADLTSYISGAAVLDLNGNAVSGKWLTTSSSVITYVQNGETTTKKVGTTDAVIDYYTTNITNLKFVPDNPNYLEYPNYPTGFLPVTYPTINIKMTQITEDLYYIGSNQFAIGSASGTVLPYSLEIVSNILTTDKTIYFTVPYEFAENENVVIGNYKDFTFVDQTTSDGLFKINLSSASKQASLTVETGSHLIINDESWQDYTINVMSGTFSLSGNTTITSRDKSVVYVSEGSSAILNGVNIVGGRTIETTNIGGAVTNHGNTTLTDCMVRGFGITATLSGTIYSTGTLTLNKTVVKDNSADAGSTTYKVSGVGVVLEGANSKLYAYNSVLNNNRFAGKFTNDHGKALDYGYGGGLYVGAGSYAYLEDCRVTSNIAYIGAGIYVAGSEDGNGGKLETLNTLIDSNYATTWRDNGGTNWDGYFGHGGGVYVGNNATAVVNGGSISSNALLATNMTNTKDYFGCSSGNGGAILVENGSLMLDGGVILQNNNAILGGAIYINSDKEVNLNNCVIKGNVTYSDSGNDDRDVFGYGGAIYAINNCNLNLNTGCEITQNIGYNNTIYYADRSTETPTIQQININGAIIHNNVLKETTSQSGVIYLSSVHNMNLNLYSGKIYNHTSTSAKNSTIVVYGGTFNMYDGEISSNVQDSIVYLLGETSRIANFNLYGGKLHSNEPTSSVIALGGFANLLIDGGELINNTGYEVNAYYSENNNITILSGKILDNKSSYRNNIYISTKATVNLFGGEVDSVVFNNIGTLNLGGNVKVNGGGINKGIHFNNLTLNADGTSPNCKVNIVEPLTNLYPIEFYAFTDNSTAGTEVKNLISLKSLSLEQIQNLNNYIFVNMDGYKFDVDNVELIDGDYYLSISTGAITSNITSVYFNEQCDSTSPDGLTEATALKTWETVLDFIKRNPTVQFVEITGSWHINKNFTFDNSLGITFKFRNIGKKVDKYTGKIIIASGVEVSFANCTFTSDQDANVNCSYILNYGSLTLDNCLLMNGYNCLYTDLSTGTSYGEGYGGAIFSCATALTLTNCTFKNNQAVRGGAIYIKDTSGSLTIDNCEFTNNNAILDPNRISKHGYLGLGGGAIFIDINKNSFMVNITNTLFDSNKAMSGRTEYIQGGAIFISSYQLDKTFLTIDNCKFTNNIVNTVTDTTSNSYGGAITAGKCNVNITNSSFVANYASRSGGALNLPSCKAVLDGLYASQNISKDGGAFLIFDINIAGANLIYKNCIIANNGLFRQGSIDAISTNGDGGKIVVQNNRYINNKTNTSIVALGSSVNDEQVYEELIKCTGLVFEGNISRRAIQVTHNSGMIISGIMAVNNNFSDNIIYIAETKYKAKQGDVKLSNIVISDNHCNFNSGIHFEDNWETNGDQHRNITISDYIFDGCGHGFYTWVKNTLNVTFNILNSKIKTQSNGIYPRLRSTPSNYGLVKYITLNVSNCIIEGTSNNTYYEYSHGIAVEHITAVNITNTHVYGFNNCNSQGAGVYLNYVAKATLDGCYIYNNVSILRDTNWYFGGGVYILIKDHGVADQTAKILNSYIYNNTNTYGRGGGIYVLGTTIVENCTISGNTAFLAGGGIYCQSGLTLKGSLVENNKVMQLQSNVSSHSAVSSHPKLGWMEQPFGGGGIAAGNVSSIYDSVVKNNYSNCVCAGVVSPAGINLSNTVLEGNISTGWSSAVYAHGSANFWNNVIIRNNKCPTGKVWEVPWDGNITVDGLQIIGNACQQVASLNSSMNMNNVVVKDNIGDGTNNLINATWSSKIQNLTIANNVNFLSALNLGNIESNNCKIIGNVFSNGILGIGAVRTEIVGYTIAGNKILSSSGMFILGKDAKTVNIKGCEIYGNIIETDSTRTTYTPLILVPTDIRFAFSNTNIYDNYINSTTLTLEGIIHNNGGELLLDNCVLSNNTYAKYVDGVSTGKKYQCGIYTTNNGYTILKDSTLEGKSTANYTVEQDKAILYFDTTAKESNIQNVKIQNFNVGDGSVILNLKTINLKNIKAQNNTGSKCVILTNYGTAKISGSDTLIAGNTSTGNGGVIYNGQTTINKKLYSGNIVILDGTFKNNKALQGGVIYNDVSTNLSILDGDFVSNVATNDASTYNGFGGVIYNLSDITINGGNFSLNIAGCGGAIYNLGSISINDAEFYRNQMFTSGGAIYNGQDTVNSTTYTGNLVINYANFTENTAYLEQTEACFGCAISNVNAELTINNIYAIGNDTTITGFRTNENANAKGGLLYVEGASAQTNIYSGTVYAVEFQHNLGGVVYASTGVTVNIKNLVTNVETGTESVFVVDNATLNMTDCIFEDGIGISLINGAGEAVVNINLCTFNGTESAMDSAVISSIKYLEVNNCVFTGDYGKSSIIYGVYQTNIKNSIFKDITTSNTSLVESSYTLDPTIVNIENSQFINCTTTGSALIGNDNYKIEYNISNCVFDGNVFENGGYVIKLGTGFTRKNHSFNNIVIKNNISYGEGGGIFAVQQVSGASPNLKLYGNIEITENKFTSGSAIYYGIVDGVSGYADLSFGYGAKVVIENNYLIDTSGNILKNADGSNKQSNFAIPSQATFDNGAIRKVRLVGGLASGSRVGINVYEVDETPVTTGTTAIYASEDGSSPITSKDLSMINYDNGAYELKLVDGNIKLFNPTVAGQGVVVSDKVIFADGSYHGFETRDFRVIDTTGEITNFKVMFAKTQSDADADNYFELSPTYAWLGEHTIWYKIVDETGTTLTQTGGEELKGTVTLNIVNKVLSIAENPIALINNGESLSSARFIGGKVVSDGFVVAGTWSFDETNAVPTTSGVSYPATFTAASQGSYSNTLKANIVVQYAFDRVEYTTQNSVVGFYNIVNKNYYNTGFTKLSEVMPYIADNGTLTICQTYTFQESERIESVANVTLLLADNFTSVAFNVGGATNVSVEFVGNIHFDGMYKELLKDSASKNFSSSTNEILLFNINTNATLSLGAGVSINNFTKEGYKGLIVNNGTLNLTGASFKNNKTISGTGDVLGGVIYNAGTLKVMGGNFVNNRACATGTNESSVASSAYGGFVYNASAGSVIIMAGTFNENSVGNRFVSAVTGVSANYSCTGFANGGVVCSNGGSVKVLGGLFARNNAQSSGGVIANVGGVIELNGGEMLQNTAGEIGGAIYNDDTNTSGKVIYNGTLITLNSLASDVTVGSAGLTQGNLSIVVLVGTFSLAVVFAVMILVMHKVHKGKKFNNK